MSTPFTATRGDKQVNSGSTASADGATASASSSQRGKQPRNLNEQGLSGDQSSFLGY